MLGALNDSLCLPGISSSGIVDIPDVQMLGARHLNIQSDVAESANNTSAFEMSMHHLLGQASIQHSPDL